MKKFITIIIALIVIAGGSYFIFSNKNENQLEDIDNTAGIIEENQTAEEAIDDIQLDLPETDFQDLEAELENL